MIKEFNVEIIGLQKAVRDENHKLAGFVTVDGSPAKRNVIAIDRTLLSYVASATSNPETGKWAIIGLPQRPDKTLLLFSIDNEGKYNAEVADYITQVKE